MKHSKIAFLSVVVFSSIILIPAFAQTTNRSYYVRADGDDENNNGRSEEAPFKTLSKAIEMASKGSVKTITIIGTLYGTNEKNRNDCVFEISILGNQELLITGKSNANETEKAVLSGEKNGAGGKSTLLYINSQDTAKIRLENIEISNAADKNHGGINVISGSVIIGEGAIISNNYARYGGGGILVENKGIVTLDGGKILNNTTERKGGGIFIEGGTFILQNGIISNNKPLKNEDGGAIFVRGGTLEIKGGLIAENSAQKGGAIYIERGTFTMTGGEIRENIAKEGGGIYNRGGVSTISNGNIKNNSAEYGAGVYVGYLDAMARSSFTVSGGIITENSADFVGGGIYVEVRGTLNQKGGTLTGNIAGDGEGENLFKQQ